MPFFYSKKYNVVVITNYKVLFSLLSNQDELCSISNRMLLVHKLRHYIKLRPKVQYYMLVRDPYDRLESFFKDKLRKSLLTYENNIHFEWQNCQKIILKRLGYDPCALDARRRLSRTSFEQFIRMLPFIYKIDAHLHPQYTVLGQYVTKFGIKIKFNFNNFEVIKVEDIIELQSKLSAMEIDLSKKINHTEDVFESLEWNSDMRMIVNDIYYKDFISWNYERLL